jgi:hypothetical protein
MIMKSNICILSFLIFLMLSSAGEASNLFYTRKNQEDSVFRSRKQICANRIQTPPKIDGRLDEETWKSIAIAKDFVVYSPGNGTVPAFDTEIRFAYDDQALYVAALMHDSHADSVCRELGKRDQVEVLITDYISIDILPYNDGLNMFEFKVTPANLQNDCKYSANGTDLNWDAVWESATRINPDSWVAEVRIPYSALRFPQLKVQQWGINMWRNNMRKREYSTWCFVNNKDQDIFKYYGTLDCIENINPPIRLSVTPYVAGYIDKSPDNRNWKNSFRGGMDLRYGINESYTLDMMLIPDFGQVQSDDQILNLSPFEVRYDEKRQFFSEGTELFNKCGIFYSRRIGSVPRNYYTPYYESKINESVVKNPTETRIINATKISGRNSRGLGVGFFNAMTLPSDAELQDTVVKLDRLIRTQDFTNYNVLVFDQNLRNNSYATLINTNYWIPDSRYIANVTGVESRINTKSRSLAVFGRFNLSQINDWDKDTDRGYLYLFSVSRPKGIFQYEIARNAMNSKYNPNDLGYLTNNNEINDILRLSHNLFDPWWKLQFSQSNVVFYHTSLYAEKTLVSYWLQLDNMTTFRNYWTNYLAFSYYPRGYTDFYEPRLWGWKYQKPKYYEMNWRIASDSRKAFRIHNSIGYSEARENNNSSWYLETIGRMRFSNRFTVSLTMRYHSNLNEYGWVSTQYDSLMNPKILFGRREVM